MLEPRIAWSRWVCWSFRSLLVIVGLLGLHPAAAQHPLPQSKLPPELRPWVPWVLDEVGGQECAQQGGDRVCLWPGRLTLDVGQQGATFRLEVVLDDDAQVPLPGSVDRWPEDVRVRKAAAVVLGETTPTIALGPGSYVISGRFVWNEPPESLTVPESLGLVSLRVNGQEIPQSRRDKPDSVWLGRSAIAASGEEERVEVEVFRRLSDGVPFRIDTTIVLRVSGPARELALGSPLLPGSRPLELEAEIPARLDNEGMLFAQVRAGEFELKLGALLPTPPKSLSRPANAGPWPEQEIWVWQPAPNLRQVAVGGLPGIDPARTNLPEKWRELSAYRVERDGKMGLVTIQRGQAAPPPNEVHLMRQLWLDEGGSGFTVRDTLSGKMNQDWRLELLVGELGHARIGSTDQLITVASTGRRGVEARSGQLDLVAEWRHASGAGVPLPCSGWSQNLESARHELHVPPGWRLLGAIGVDDVTGGWLESWNIFAAVYVLLVAMVMARLTRWYWGIAALVALALCHEYEAAPNLVWLPLLALLAWLRVEKRRAVRVSLLAITAMLGLGLLSSTVTFSVKQLRAAFHPDPSLDDGRRDDSGALLFGGFLSRDHIEAINLANEGQVAVVAQVAEDSEMAKARNQAAPLASDESPSPAPQPSTSRLTSSPKKGKLEATRQDFALDAVVQTGPGVPTWQGTTHVLSWRGPVRKDQTLRLILLSPWQTGLLGFMRVTALLALVFALVRALARAVMTPPEPPVATVSASPAPVALFLTVLLAALLGARNATADIPSEGMLSDLKQRLTRGADCGEACASVPSLSLSMRDSTMRLELEVHVGKPIAFQLAGPATTWVPNSVSVNGKKTSAVTLRPDGYLHVRLPPGRHRVTLEGPVGGSELTLSLGVPVRRVSVDAGAWEVDGLRDGQVEGTLHVSKKSVEVTSPEASKTLEQARPRFPPWLEVHRRLEVGVTWKIRTTVTRVSPVGDPLAIRFPLVAGEEVTESTLQAEHGAVLLSLARDQEVLEFTSVVKPTSSLIFVAAASQPWSEIWTLECGVMWHCETAGIAPEQYLANESYEPRFRPWPGDRVHFSFTRPSAAPGASTTIDRAIMNLNGESSTTTATLAMRTSRGGVYELTLPADASVTSLTVGGAAQPIQVRDRRLNIVLQPGEQTVTITFRRPRPESGLLRAPEVRAGAAVNAQTSITIPKGRFPVFTWGEGRGGAVLLWEAIALLVIGALALSLLPYHPLRRWEWALLALGFPLVPWFFLTPVAGWFFLVGWRVKWTPTTVARRRLATGLITATSVLAAMVVVGVLGTGFLAAPDVLLSGVGSGGQIVVFAVDRVIESASLPRPSVLTAPDWTWRVCYLGWATWLTSILWRTGRKTWAAMQQ